MRLSVGLANAREGRQNPFGAVRPADLLRFAAEADAMGFHALWANEAITTHPKLKHSPIPPLMLEPMVTLASIAGITKRARLVVSTVALPLHDPISLAHQAASLDQLSAGRFTLGIGLGGRDQFKQLRPKAVGVHRGHMMEEQLQLMRRLWTESEVTFDGLAFGVTDVTLSPHPVQNPLPVLEAGKAEAVLERAARFTQGWIDSAHDPDAIAPKIARLRELTQQAGREWTEMTVARQFYCALGQSDLEARAIASDADPSPDDSFGFSGAGMESQLIGDVGRILDRLSAYAAVGVSEVCLIFYYASQSAALRQLETAASDLLPQVTAL